MMEIKHLITKCGLEHIDKYTYSHALSGNNSSAIFCYKATDGTKIAVKMLIAPRGQWELDQFLDEVETLRRFTFSRNTLGYFPKVVIDYNKVDELPIHYIGLEYFEGITISDYIQINPTPWPWHKIMCLMSRMCAALGDSLIGHVHRDLHFGNILITDVDSVFKKRIAYKDNLGVIILDAGSASFIVKEIYDGDAESLLRLPGAVSTWSPEMLKGEQIISYSHDSWGLGILLHEMLTSQKPIQVRSIGELVSLFNQDYISLPLIDASDDIPIGIKLLVKNMLSINHKKRLIYGEIATFCEEAINTDLMMASPEVIQVYIDSRCNMFTCAYCGKISTSARCETCHKVMDDENSIPIYSYAKLAVKNI